MKKFLSSVGSWIWGIILFPFIFILAIQFFAGIIVCIIAFPISMVGYTLNQGISKHSQINKAIKKAKVEGQEYYLDWSKINNDKSEANKNLFLGSLGTIIIIGVYVLIFIFYPQLFRESLNLLWAFVIGLLGGFLVPGD